MLCDGVCMKNMHRLLDGTNVFVVDDGTCWEVIGKL
jgi:hypothetical protein